MIFDSIWRSLTSLRNEVLLAAAPGMRSSHEIQNCAVDGWGESETLRLRKKRTDMDMEPLLSVLILFGHPRQVRVSECLPPVDVWLDVLHPLLREQHRTMYTERSTDIGFAEHN